MSWTLATGKTPKGKIFTSMRKCVVDTGEQFFGGVVDTGEKF